MNTPSKPKRKAVTFLDPTDIEVVALAKLGGSSAMISERTGLSMSQITYRVTKAKIGEGMEKGNGYRTDWRNGTSPYYQLMSKAILPKIRATVRAELPFKFGLPSKT